MAFLADAWGSAAQGLVADLNGDRKIDHRDGSIFLAHFGGLP